MQDFMKTYLGDTPVRLDEMGSWYPEPYSFIESLLVKKEGSLISYNNVNKFYRETGGESLYILNALTLFAENNGCKYIKSFGGFDFDELEENYDIIFMDLDVKELKVEGPT